MGIAEGLNNVTVQSNVCSMEYPTAGRAKRIRASTAQPRANLWERKGESTQGNVRVSCFEVILNRRMPNGMYGGVRGEREYPLLDFPFFRELRL